MISKWFLLAAFAVGVVFGVILIAILSANHEKYGR